ncbi:unnamed protein product [Sphagnum balticum]
MNRITSRQIHRIYHNSGWVKRRVRFGCLTIETANDLVAVGTGMHHVHPVDTTESDPAEAVGEAVCAPVCAVKHSYSPKQQQQTEA